MRYLPRHALQPDVSWAPPFNGEWWEKPTMNGQTAHIHSDNWQTLIILDACRYDYFMDEYPTYLDGHCEPVKSPASCTYDWLNHTWPAKYPLTYVSAMPSINSYDIFYPATTHFTHVIDAWDDGWNHTLGTTPPENVNQIVKDLVGLKPTRKIIHYAQPHQPFIGPTRVVPDIHEPPFPFTNHPQLPATMWRTWRLKARLPVTQRTGNKILDAYRRGKISTEKLRLGYRDNVRRVLHAVQAILPTLADPVVITADHGELLGETAQLWHPCDIAHPLLRTVPWCTVD